MVKFINAVTGSVMWVDEARVAEYEAAGHRREDGKPAPAAKPRRNAGKTTGKKG